MHVPPPRPAARERGAAMVAFAITALPLMFCALFIVEAARWHITRQILNLALLDAARAGATAHARPAVIEQAFETALLPLFEPPGRHGSPRARMRARFLEVAQQTGALPWRIDVLSPAAKAYADFGDAALRVPGASGLRAISNDYQAEQHLRRRRMGWPGGRGPRSGETIFEANMLRLRLVYAHQPLVPGLRAVLRWTAALRSGRDPTARAGMLVIKMEMDLPMQSHPVQWQANADVQGGAARDRLDAMPHDAGARSSTGRHSPRGDIPIPGRSPRHPGTGVGIAPVGGAMPSSGNRPTSGMGTLIEETPPGDAEPSSANGTPASDAQSSPDDPACGVLLCCVASSST